MNRTIPNVGDLVHPHWHKIPSDDDPGQDLDDIGIVIFKFKSIPDKSDPYQVKRCEFVFKIFWLYGIRAKEKWFSTVDWYDYELKVVK